MEDSCMSSQKDIISIENLARKVKEMVHYEDVQLVTK